MADAPWDQKQYFSEHDVVAHVDDNPVRIDYRRYWHTIDGHVVQDYRGEPETISVMMSCFMAGLNLGYRLGRYDGEQE